MTAPIRRRKNEVIKVDFAGQEELEIYLKNDGMVAKPIKRQDAALGK